MKRALIISLSATLLASCSVVPASRTDSRSQQVAMPRGIQAPVASSQPASQCLSDLGQAGAQFIPLPDSYTGEGCSNVGTVQMSAVRGDQSMMSLANIGPVQCGVSTAFAAWARYGVDRAARQILGSPLQQIETFGSYSCRNVAGSARRSAHATAGAIDIAGFILADGRRITVASDWNDGSSAEREFLRVVQQSACRRFNTVLGPEYNAAHHDHFHVEGVIEGSSFCR